MSLTLKEVKAAARAAELWEMTRYMRELLIDSPGRALRIQVERHYEGEEGMIYEAILPTDIRERLLDHLEEILKSELDGYGVEAENGLI